MLLSNPLDAGGFEVRNVRLHLLASDPGTPTDGMYWYNSNDHEFKYRAGGVTYVVGTGLDITAMHKTTAGELAAMTAVTPASGDLLLIEDVSDGNNKKKITVSTLPFDPAGTSSAAIAALVGTAPGVLDTLGEIADALNDDAALYATLVGLINAKPSRYSVNVGNGAATDITLTHNLGTRDVQVQVYDLASYEQVLVDNDRTTVNTVVLHFAVAPATDEFRAVVLG